ncbi:hypothetical protein KCV07_g6802, partial [Aureobasidium melanogenum]
MADSQIYSNEDLQVACQLYLRYIYSDYFQPTPSAFPSGSASNPVVIQDDNPPGSSLNPVVILDDEPLNPRREPQTIVPIPEHLADAVQVQSPALEIEDSSADSGSDSISSRPSPNSDLSVTSGVLSTIPPDSIDSSSTTEASSTSDPSPEPQHSPISDATPPTSPISDEWIARFSRNAATQVNLAEFSTDVDVGEKNTVQSNPLPHSVFTAISSSTQTAFPEVHVGRKSYRSVGSDGCVLNEKRLPVGGKVKTMKDSEEVKGGQDSMPSTCNEASDYPAPGAFLEIFDNNQQGGSKNPEQDRLEAKARCQQEIQRVVEQTTLEANEEPGIETTSLDTEDSCERNTPSSPSTPTSPVTPSTPVSAEFEKTVSKNLNETLSILEENPEEHLSERADEPVSSSQPSTSMGFEQADIQQETEGSSNSQETGQENLFEYFDVSVIRSSSPVCSDRAHSPSVTRATSTAIDIPMVPQDVPTSPAPAGSLTCSTVRCPNQPSSNDFKCISCRAGRSSIEHKQKNNLLGRASVRKRKHKPRKSLANKKQKPDSNSECRNSAMTDATLQNDASIGNSQAVSLPGGNPISWQELCYTVMLEAPNHSSNFKQLCNLVRNWLHNTFPTIEFDINDEIMLQNLQAVLKNSANFDIHEQPIKRKKKNPIEVSIRENAIKKVKIVVSCFRAKLARPEYYHNMATHLLPKSRARPEVSFENLIGMALHALPNKYVEEIEIITWIAEMVVGYQTSFSGRNGLGYKYQGDWKQQLREELHASSFFKMRVSEAGDEEWKFRKGCAEYFRKWNDSLH